MSLYLAGSNTGIVSPNFRDRGIANMQPAEIDDILVVAVSTNKNHNYVWTFENIHNILLAQLKNSFVFADAKPVSVFKDIKSLVSFEVPVATFNFQGMDDDKRSRLAALGLQREVGSSSTYSGSPAIRDLSTILSMGLIRSRFTPGKVSSDGYLAYGMLLRGLHVFTTVSGYAAFNPRENLWMAKGTVQTAGKDAVSIYSPMGVANPTKVSIYETEGHLCAGQLLATTIAPITTSRDLDAMRLVVCEPGNSLPHMAPHNAFFPYFTGMLLADKVKAWHVFSSLFGRCIGDEKTTVNMAQTLRSGCRQLAFTSAGMAMSHAYTGIEIAKSISAALVLVVSNGQYHGFVLQSPNKFTVSTSTGEVESTDAAKVEKEVKAAGGSVMLLGEIVAILNAPVKDDGMPLYNFTIEDIRTARQFVSVWCSVSKEAFSKDQVDSLKEKLSSVVFPPQKFAPVSVSSIETFLNYVQTGDNHLLSGLGAYVGASYWEYTDRVSVGLGIFGSRAPSLNSAQSGQVFSLPGTLEADDPNLKANRENKKPLQYLPFEMVAIRNACAQWNSIFGNGKFTIHNPRKNKKEFTDGSKSDLKASGDPSFSNIYRKIVSISINVRGGLRSGKRARANDDDESGPSAARKRAKKANQDLAANV